MKVTIKINGAEVILEAQKPEEIPALGPLAASILEGATGGPAKRTRAKAGAETGVDSELAQARIGAVEWVLSTSPIPLNAPEVSGQVKSESCFYTKSGDPIHVVRRVLAEGVQLGVFLKTTGGLFTVPSDEEVIRAATDRAVLATLASTRPSLAPIPAHLERPSAEDDMDDPFADN